MSTAKDPLLFMEATYSFVQSEEAWLERIVDTLRPYDLGGGIAAYSSELGEKIAVRSIANETKLESATIHKMVTDLPPAFFRRLHAPMPIGSSLEFFPRAAREVGLPTEIWPQALDAPTPSAAWAFCGGDANVETALVVFHCQPGEAFSDRDKHVLECFGAHLGSALRLRSLLGSQGSQVAPQQLTGDHTSVDAVISPDGKLLDARGEVGDSEGVRAPLIDAVRRLEHAKLRRATDEERLDVWTALFDGRWSILENVESDGKRMMLVCRNDPRTSQLRLLTPRERAVVTYAALGHSFKYIAYELGIALPTAAANLKSALRKLGLPSRAELIKLLSHPPSIEE